MSRNLQLGIHPDADKISVFVEGAATAREQEKMLAHLAECAECRKAVFLMQPHEEPQRVAATPERRWMWRWLVPVGMPAAGLACGLIAVLVYIRPQGASKTPQQMASTSRRPPETERPGPTAALSINSEQVAGSGGRQDGLAEKPATKVYRQQRPMASGLNLPTAESEQATANLALQKTGAAPSVVGGPVADAARLSGGIGTVTVSELPLNGRNFTDLQQLQPADTKGVAENGLAKEKTQPELQIERASGKDETLAGVSGSITDRSGAVIAGVAVTLRDAAGKTRQTTTGADGSFHLTDLPAGRYELTAAAGGFKTSEQSIELKPSELAMLEPKLDVGAVSEAVEVEVASGAVQAESASLGSQVGAELPVVGRAIAIPSGLPVAETVSHGKRFLSLNNAGDLFLSRNEGKKWKKIKPQWAGKAIRIELTSESVGEAAQTPKHETLGAAGEGAVFLLTTDSGTVWSSKDGAHWHPITSPR